MRSKTAILTLVLLLSLVIFNFTFLPVSQAVSSTVVISEFRTRGPNGGNDEFIELYNLSSSPINISGWEIKGSNNTGTVSTRALINNGIILNPGCHYLLTNSNPTGGPYSGPVAGNQTYSVGITDNGGIALTLPSGTIIDQVGMSNGSVYKEGSTLSPLSGESNRSYERRPGGSTGNATDTDNNNADFRSISPSNPQNASSSCIAGNVPVPTNPSGIGFADPSSVIVGDSILFQVKVTNGTNPTSTILAVRGNLSNIGGSSSQQFFDNGTNGDTVAKDNTFSFQATVAANTQAGQKFIPIAIVDAQLRTATTLILFLVESSPDITPIILNASVNGKKLLVSGSNFDDGAKIYVNGEKQKTKNDSESPTSLLVAKKAGKQVAKGATVILKVKNSDGTLSDDFTFKRPD